MKRFISLYILPPLIILGLIWLIPTTITLVQNDFDKSKAHCFGYQLAYVPTESMEPTIKTYRPLFLKMTTFDEVEVGDIITYQNEWSGENTVIHRVVEKHEDYLITKGDNNPVCDPFPVYKEQVIAKTLRDRPLPTENINE